jgi:biopolymer transport protein ExbD
MASSSGFERGQVITGINITPLVDVVLVLLIVLMVTATYVASQAIPMDLPRSATGESSSTTLAISVDGEGNLFLDTRAVSEHELRLGVRTAKASGDTRALIAADGATAHRRVVRVLDLLRQEGVRRFAINVQPATPEAER